ncbi:NADP-dependent phosphogluconate dehydrogenase [Marinovum sp. 2_MG-2023]|uniref:NADP-dependent phosphogluconate dehydrogenase n=1 Tax=unclassified Marinovum TaxID=2647166 RepID=UPI0026E28E25|nr:MULTISPECIES: NADP-dependent phosphogluconate dehydrogenase [unclassified Marinovum]MDO6728841.1 NADP-dependent phosphogluconate dehydrogenase [Marinovum sp. 2_MG-2023]MDO6777743.1 NADP-dependent phosphogluconate dehydrogenase [Marinovum sp. 1_MG-2023]
MTSQIGIYGLGTMGSALALNMADKGIQIAVSNRSAAAVPEFLAEAGQLADRIAGYDSLEAMIEALPCPRTILFMIPSTGPMDDMMDHVIPLLSAGDTVIDAGNADFHATRARSQRLAEHDLHFVGMGVSGGEEGARVGPSMMVGGTVHSWGLLQPVAEAIAAKFEGAPCVAHLGPDGAGHFVKMVHNGIEYADMQAIAEVYGLLRFGAGQDPAAIAARFATWNEGPLQSFLTEITAKTLASTDDQTGQPMVDVIVDSAGQKGTGRWTVIEALKLGQSANTIEAAVGARIWSAQRSRRAAAADLFDGPSALAPLSDDDLEKALLATRILGHSQGFDVMQAGSDEYGWDLDMGQIARIWRAGCIIRSALLDVISEAYADAVPEQTLMLAPAMRDRLAETLPALRRVVGAAVAAGYPLPVMSAALTWYDAMRQARGSAAMIQAQRDFFGHHGFARFDSDGAHHGSWTR